MPNDASTFPDSFETSATQRVRVLLVDDHPVMRQGMAAIINEEPDLMVCGEADGVRSAIDAIAGGRPDVALIDLSIRDGDGLELVREIRHRYPQVRTLVLSMFDEQIYAERALKAGAGGYVMKAEAAKTVMSGIRAVLRDEVFVSPEMARLLAPHSRQKCSDPAAATSRLSDRELQVLRCIGRGLSTREVADELFISIKTVEAHREHIKSKLGLAGAGELLRYAILHNRISE